MHTPPTAPADLPVAPPAAATSHPSALVTATGLRVAVIGAGPAGLMAAETLVASGASVQVFDAMPSVGRKFLLAGKGGLNLTHAEPLADFTRRYAERGGEVGGWLSVLGPQGLRDWAEALGIETFVGTSGRVFPGDMKAAPLLRAWLQRLRAAGVVFHQRHRWSGQGLVAAGTPVSGEAACCPADCATVSLGAQGPLRLSFDAPVGRVETEANAVVLALGGASWARLGSDGAWVAPLLAAGVAVAPLRPANCGFEVAWSPHLVAKYAGSPLKNVRLRFQDGLDEAFDRLGECVLSATGLEGSLIYAASARLREAIVANGAIHIHLDLLPGRSLEDATAALARGRGARSLANHLKEQVGISGVKAGLLREGVSASDWAIQSRSALWLAQRLKALPVTLLRTRPLDEAISTAGGVRLEALSPGLELLAVPGVFCAGEMLDWEAPTGGYLLTAVMASGRVAGQGVLAAWAARGGAVAAG